MEVLVGIFVLTLIGLAVWAFQKDIFSLETILSSSITVQEEARRAFKPMGAEIRTLSPSSTGAYPILQTSTTSFTFYSNLDSEPLKERIRYFLDGTTLKKGVIKPSGSPLVYNPANETVTDLVHNLANGATPIFSYYDTNYDGTTPPLAEPINITAVRLVKIMLILDQDPSRSPGPIALTTQISIRNLKDNL